MRSKITNYIELGSVAKPRKNVKFSKINQKLKKGKGTNKVLSRLQKSQKMFPINKAFLLH